MKQFALIFLLATVVAARAADGDGFVPLFNGRDLTGWTPKFAKHELGVNLHDTFRVEDGVLKVAIKP